MQPQVQDTLKLRNSHERDKHIVFMEEGHTYNIQTDPMNKYTSVTTWNHSHFPHFDADNIIKKMMKGKSWREGHKYWGLSPEQIKEQWNTNKEESSLLGTNLHFRIECFMNNSNILFPYTQKELYDDYTSSSLSQPFKTTQDKEWDYFITFLKEMPHLKPYRTEWPIYHEELKLAGTIDMVYENADNTLSIYDWKRAKDITKINTFNQYAITECICHLFDSNFWHYALQLNIYKAILEEKYNKKIKDMYLVRLHPNNEEETYELIQVPHLKNEIQDLFTERKNENNNNKHT